MRFASMLINLTEQCNVGCRHCGYIGSRRDREMTEDELDSWVEQVARYGVRKIIFTGGEAFERYDLLVRGVRRAQACNALTAVFTSSFWASSTEQARATLRGIEGISQLYLSTDVYRRNASPRICPPMKRPGSGRAEGKPDHHLCHGEERASVAAHAQYGHVEIMSQLLIPIECPDGLKGHVLNSVSPRNNIRSWLGTLINPDGSVFACPW